MWMRHAMRGANRAMMKNMTKQSVFMSGSQNALFTQNMNMDMTFSSSSSESALDFSIQPSQSSYACLASTLNLSLSINDPGKSP
jgi:hypothetical protein